MRFSALAALMLVVGCTKTPEEAVQAHSATVSNGFESRGAVALTAQHALVHLELIETSETTPLRVGPEAGLQGRILNRDEGLSSALVYLDRSIDAPALGDSGALELGSTLHTGAFGKEGIEHHTGKVTGIRTHKKRWYLETDLKLTESQLGAGLFNDEGELVGIYAFELTPSLRYVLPVEYLSAVDKAIGAGISDHDASEAFKVRADEASKSSVVLAPPPSFEDLEVKHNFARTDLVGSVTCMSKKDAPLDPAAATWILSSVVDADKREPIALGALGAEHSQWHHDAEAQKKSREELVAQFGESTAKERLDPYESGELRFRIPGNAFCDKVADATAYALVVELGDGRKTDELTYGDLLNVCAGMEEGDGAAWVSAWAMEPVKTAKATKKGKKRKRRRKKR